MSEVGLPETPQFPDPLISANLYASGRLDRVIDRFVVPFWHAIEASNLDDDCYLWILRYARCGEHLKLRIHGPESLHSSLQALLKEAADTYLAGRDPEEEALPTPQRQKPAPPLDVEDQGMDNYPDGTFLYTHYQRSPALLGAPLLARDDRYAALFTRALGQACALILSLFELDETGRMPHRRRQALLLRIATVGLSATFSEREDLERYITYHRDWLVRAPVLAARWRRTKAVEILNRYDSETTRVGTAYLKTIRDLFQDQGSVSRQETGWQRSLVAVRRDLEEIQGLDPDPFVEGPLYPSLFKVFHSVANQLGVNFLNEGLTWHLLLSALRGDGARDGFRLVPF